jgi:tRNA (cytidine32/guanosine34-2'-O)-methyltransferase
MSSTKQQQQQHCSSKSAAEECLKEEQEEQQRCIVSVDLQAMAPVPGVTVIKGDITRHSTAMHVIRQLRGKRCELVVFDGAPDVTGLHDVDEFIQQQLVLTSLNIAAHVLARGGTFIAKVFRGKSINSLYDTLQRCFERVAIAKPKASRNSSLEGFVVCQGFLQPMALDGAVDDIVSSSNNSTAVTATSTATAAAAAAATMDEQQAAAEQRADAILASVDVSGEPHPKSAAARGLPVPFVACGAADAFDSVMSYPLQLPAATKQYVHRAATMQPINPPYQQFLAMKRDNAFTT